MEYNYDDDTGDDFVTCPYNYTHRVRRSKMSQHVTGCEWMNLDLKACPYNICHRYTEREMANHMQICSSRPPSLNSRDNPWDELGASWAGAYAQTSNASNAAGASEAGAFYVPPPRHMSVPRFTYRPRASLSVPRAYMPEAARRPILNTIKMMDEERVLRQIKKEDLREGRFDLGDHESIFLSDPKEENKLMKEDK